MNSIFNKSGNVYDKKDKVSMFLLTMYLSHDKHLLPLVEKINKIQFQLNDKQIYDYYYNTIPKGKKFIKWVKKDESKSDDKNLKKLYDELLYEHPNLSDDELKLYKPLLMLKKEK
jgi:hypothetical protein